MHEFWQQEYFGNSLLKWISVVGMVTGGILLVYLVKFFLVKKLAALSKATRTTIDDFILQLFTGSFIPFVYFLVIYEGLLYVAFTQRMITVLHNILLIVAAFFILRAITSILQYLVQTFLGKQAEGELKQKQAKGLVIIAKSIVWILGIVFVLNNLGYNVSTIIAGLGIGGIAIALAAQTILGDLFSYFVILFDRPFEIGDFIIVDDKMGVVEYIGIKSTRLRTLSGEQLICSNKNLTDSRVHNFKRMEKRRVVFTLGVTYQTTSDTLKSIPPMVKNIISRQNDIVFDRGNFSGFGDFSLNFEFVYYILSSDYNLYMERQQGIYFEIFKAFEKNNIKFAYPTQTVFVNDETVSLHAN